MPVGEEIVVPCVFCGSEVSTERASVRAAFARRGLAAVGADDAITQGRAVSACAQGAACRAGRTR